MFKYVMSALLIVALCGVSFGRNGLFSRGGCSGGVCNQNVVQRVVVAPVQHVQQVQRVVQFVEVPNYQVVQQVIAQPVVVQHVQQVQQVQRVRVQNVNVRQRSSVQVNRSVSRIRVR